MVIIDIREDQQTITAIKFADDMEVIISTDSKHPIMIIDINGEEITMNTRDTVFLIKALKKGLELLGSE